VCSIYQFDDVKLSLLSSNRLARHGLSLMQCGLVRTQSATSKPLESYLKCDRSQTRPSPADPYGALVDAVLLLVDNRPYAIVLFGLQGVRPSWPINFRAIKTVLLHSRDRIWFDFAFDAVQQGETSISLFP